MFKIIKKIDTKIRYDYQQYLQRKFCPDGGGVLVFHEVVDDLSKASGPDYAISTEDFKTFVNTLRKQNAEFGSFSGDIESNKVYFTFDDGYKCNLDTAYPVLEENQIEYIVFVPTGYIEGKDYMTKEQIIKLSQSDYATIGGHSKSHCSMLERNDAELTDEICNSKTELEDIIGKTVDYFAFPYGSLNAVGKKGIDKAREAGYRYAFSTLCIDNKRFHNAWFYPRITVTSSNYNEVLKRL